MESIANTPKPPYYAVIFTADRANVTDGYDEMARQMVEMVQTQPGFLGLETAESRVGILVSYWDSLESIRQWQQHGRHQEARVRGRTEWYSAYKTRICKVEREYGHHH
ncbi:antibiotic biosynthesis monooxygenase family protein [Alicyclobacillus suci]|uniref:antibiotic biosynthesis monooxygenase family protein n=1 Tax=Alicyclobacillus suci TaxID=2816080 RepID=UPI001A8F0ED3|nr:antibiotic biosynthesis monooxygenase [Alicyclobacillus suci]